MLGVKDITEQVAELPAPYYIPLKTRIGFRKKLKTRTLANISLGELDVLNSRNTSSDEYFINSLAVMLGLVHFENRLPGGKPDWMAGWSADTKSVCNLHFIRAFRYFIECQKEVEAIAKAFSKLGAWNPKKRSSKNRGSGMVDVCSQYCHDMNGAVSLEAAWNTPWAVVYRFFEECDEKNHEQYIELERQKMKHRR